jgi:ribosomal protein S18 acetylase RimI-like enzyme
MPEVVMNQLLVRPLQRDDFAEVMRIENASFPAVDAWSQRKFESLWRRPQVKIWVGADQARQVVGYLVCERSDEGFRLLNLAVDPLFRRRRVAWLLVWQVLSAAHCINCCSTVKAIVEEENLPAQQFLRSRGFRAQGLSHDADRSWIDFEWFSAGAAGFRDEGSAVLANILHGDGRTLRV